MFGLLFILSLSRGGVEEGGTKGKNALPRKKATWSEEEVQALTAGVEKYGTGLWKQILNDAEFASSLKNRSNINLKVYRFSLLIFFSNFGGERG